MAKMSFTYDDRALKANISGLHDKVDDALHGVAEYHGLEGTAYMKEHAPWTDRTTNARNGLHTVVPEPVRGRHEIIFSHTVHYGIWLEIANSGRYQIIMPAVRHEGELLMRRLDGLFRKLDEL
jgi:hypothetical protein